MTVTAHAFRSAMLTVSLASVIATVGAPPGRTQDAGAAVMGFPPPADTGQFPPEEIRSRCIDFSNVTQGVNPEDYRDCAVTESGRVGEVDGETYSYAIYCLIPGYVEEDGKCGDDSFSARYHQSRGLAIFIQERGSAVARVLLDRADPELGLYYYRKPEIVRTPAGLIFHVPIALDGTGAGNESEYYLREQQRWQPIDARSWLDELMGYVPAGLAIRKGLWPELGSLTAEAGLYQEEDPNCCPSGGSLRIRLAVRSSRFVIESAEFHRPGAEP